MKTEDEITARLGRSVVALASLCIVLAAIIILMLDQRYTTDVEIAVDQLKSDHVTQENKTGVIVYSPKENGIDGQKLFKQNCAVCHALTTSPIAGPGLAGAIDRVPSREWLHKWIKNADAVKKSGDAYAVDLDKRFPSANMNVFSYLSDAEVDALIDFISAVPAQ